MYHGAMQGILLLLTQGLIYFAVMAALFRARRVLGLGAFLCALGVMHFLETYLAAVFFIQLPFGVVSPGSTVLFSGKLAIILLFYIREDAEKVREPIYGLLIGNFLIVALVMTLRLSGPPLPLPGYQADLALIDQMGALMVWGTTLLFVDAIAIILLYERLHRQWPNSILMRAGASLAVILTFDQISFFLGLHFLTGAPWAALMGGWIAKMGASIFYAALMVAYLSHFERQFAPAEPASMSDVFSKLTFRRRYEQLLQIAARDTVTGALTRERFEAMGRDAIERAIKFNKPLSIAMIDVDEFKRINDSFGHATGDRVLREVVATIRTEIRSADTVFRYGGDEFVLLFENMPHIAALGLAERIRTSANQRLNEIAPTDITLSIGVATCPEDAVQLVDLVTLADAQLYRAKRNGRNQVVSAHSLAA